MLTSVLSSYLLEILNHAYILLNQNSDWLLITQYTVPQADRIMLGNNEKTTQHITI